MTSHSVTLESHTLHYTLKMIHPNSRVQQVQTLRTPSHSLLSTRPSLSPTISTPRTCRQPEGTRRNQKEPEGTRRNHIEPEGTRRNQIESHNHCQHCPCSHRTVVPVLNTHSHSLRTPQLALLVVATQMPCHLAFITRHALISLPDTGYTRTCP